MKNAQKLLCLALSLLLVLTAAPGVSAAGIGVTINGQELEFDVPPVIILGRTLVPLRSIFEALGADVHYDQDTKKVTGLKGEVRIELTINRQEAYRNGVLIMLDVPATIVNGRTMVPARFIAESLDCEVHWDGSTRMVTIQSPTDSGDQPAEEPGEGPGEEPGEDIGNDPGDDGPGEDPAIPGNPGTHPNPGGTGGTVKVSVAVSELFGIKTFTVEVHSLDVPGGRYWTLGDIGRDKQEVGQIYTRSGTGDTITLYVFDMQGKLLDEFTVEYKDCTEVTLGK